VARDPGTSAAEYRISDGAGGDVRADRANRDQRRDNVDPARSVTVHLHFYDRPERVGEHMTTAQLVELRMRQT
jgi:hypothetical protein